MTNLLNAIYEDVALRSRQILYIPLYAPSTRTSLVVLFVAIGQGIDMRIVDQGMVAISPGKLLGPNAEMVVRNEWRSFMLRPIRHSKSIHMSKTMTGIPTKRKQFLHIFQPSAECPADILRAWTSPADLACCRNLTYDLAR